MERHHPATSTCLVDLVGRRMEVIFTPKFASSRAMNGAELTTETLTEYPENRTELIAAVMDWAQIWAEGWDNLYL